MKHETVLTDMEINDLWVEHGLDDCDPDGFARLVEQAVLAKLEQRQEPVGEVSGIHKSITEAKLYKALPFGTLLYTHPPTDTAPDAEWIARREQSAYEAGKASAAAPQGYQLVPIEDYEMYQLWASGAFAGKQPTPALLERFIAACNYIDTLGGDSKSYRAAIEAYKK